MTIIKNTICWADIPVLDLDRACKFYASILNEPVDAITEHGFKFALLAHKEDNVACCLTIVLLLFIDSLSSIGFIKFT